jgi:polyphosphate kinase 2
MTTKKIELSNDDVALLNSKIGLKYLFANDKVNVAEALRLSRYEVKLREMQEQLVHLQNWVIQTGQRVIVLFEGRDAAGKGGAIRRITAHINPRHYRIVALPKPTDEEKGQWYFQRYVNTLPKPGEILFFDRSWYNRAVVEPVNSFCSTDEYKIFMSQVNGFENMLVESGAFLVKLYFSITKAEQSKRFADIKTSPLKRWKMSNVDIRAQELWTDYTRFKKRMFAQTDTDIAPWKVIEANIKSEARLTALEHLLEVIPYKVLPTD